MGLLDQYAAFAKMNPNARNIANEMASYMDTVSNRQKQQYQDMFKYAPASQPVAQQQVETSPFFRAGSPTGDAMNVIYKMSNAAEAQGGK